MILPPSTRTGATGFFICESGVDTLDNNATVHNLEGMLVIRRRWILSEFFMDLRVLGAGNDLDNIGTKRWSDSHFKMIRCPWDFYRFVGMNESVPRPSVREKNHRSAITLVTEHRDMAILGASDTETDIFPCHISALPIPCEYFNWKIFGDLLKGAHLR